MTFCDLSTFYCDKGGGIRTYHRAKIEWFAAQSAHRYVIVYAGRRFRVVALDRNVTGVEVFGPQVGYGTGGYRLMLDYWRVRDVLRTLRPDVVEVEDPWVSGPFALVARRRGHLSAMLTSFFHTDPINAYLKPWFQRHFTGATTGSTVVVGAERVFARVQSAYDCTFAASRVIQDRLLALGVRHVVRTPFGVDPVFFAPSCRRRRAGGALRLLYVGRLQKEKRFDLILDVLPRLWRMPGVSLTVAGAGPLASAMEGAPSGRLTFRGYVQTRSELRAVFDDHDLLLAPAPNETFGLAALEAMASGLVVAGAMAGGTGELLREVDSPFGFPPGDADGLVRAVEIAAGANLDPWSARSRQVAAEYGTWRDAISRQISVYAELAAGERRS
jgi:alpha-1,6-mannosyltransferase